MDAFTSQNGLLRWVPKDEADRSILSYSANVVTY